MYEYKKYTIHLSFTIITKQKLVRKQNTTGVILQLGKIYWLNITQLLRFFMWEKVNHLIDSVLQLHVYRFDWYLYIHIMNCILSVLLFATHSWISCWIWPESKFLTQFLPIVYLPSCMHLSFYIAFRMCITLSDSVLVLRFPWFIGFKLFLMLLC